MRAVEIGIGALVTITALALIFSKNSQSTALTNAVFSGATGLLGTATKGVQ